MSLPALQAPEQLLSLALDVGGLTAWEWDLAAGTVIFSGHAADSFRLPPGERALTIEAALAGIHPADLPAHRAALAAALEGGDAYRLELRARGPDGLLRWLDVRGRVQRDDLGRPARILGMARDISAEKLRGRALALHRAIGQALTPNLDVAATLAALARLPLPDLAAACAIFLLDDDGRLQPAVACAAGEAAPLPLAPLVEALGCSGEPGPLEAALRSACPQQLAEPPPGLAAALGAPGAGAALLLPLSAYGQTLGLLLLAPPADADAPDALDPALAEALARRGAEAIAFARLQAATQAAQRAASEAHARLDALIRSAPNGIGYLDRNLRYALVNPALAALNCRPADEHVGRRIGEILPVLAPRFEPLVRQVLETGEPTRDIELRGPERAGGGPPREWLIRYFPVLAPDQLVAGVGVTVTDITESKRAEDQARAALAAEQAARLAAEQVSARTTRLQALTAGLAGALSEEAVIRVITEQGAVAAGATTVIVGLLSGADDPLDLADMPDTLPALPTAPLVLASGAPVWLASCEQAEAYLPGLGAALAGLGCAALATLPLRSAERALGTVSFGYAAPNAFAEVDRALLRSLAQQCALALERTRLYTALLASQERLQHLSQRLIQAQEEERRHLARELHDEVGQDLTGLRLSLELACRQLPEECSRALGEARRATQELIAKVRALSLDLRPAMLDDAGLLPALLWQLKRYRERTGLVVELRHQGMERALPPAAATVAYRVVQEALTNIARHAEVETATVRLLATPAQLLVQVRDGGRGFVLEEALAGGRSGGLTGMQERVALLGGTVSIETAPGQGTYLTVDLPLDGGGGL